MTRVLQSPAFDDTAIGVPAPPAWDSVAVAAFEQGFAQGAEAGRSAGRRDLMLGESNLRSALDECMGAIESSLHQFNQRVIEVAELFVTTALRHIPEARTTGLLVRMGEVLATFDPGTVVVSVEPDAVTEVSEAFARRPPRSHSITVTADRTLATGEFRLQSEWADAEGTFQRYIEAAREAVELHLGLDSR